MGVEQMRVLFFCTEKALAAGDRLEEIVRDCVPEQYLHVSKTIDELRRQLWLPLELDQIAVIVAANDQELEEILSMEDLLDRYRIVLIIWNWQSETLSEAHKLRPRFLTHVDDNLSDVGLVLETMLYGRMDCGRA
jgi:hypothetical protein